jgi:alpha-mannosidase
MDDFYFGWEAEKQLSGAWLEIGFSEARPVAELWILPNFLPRHIIAQELFTLLHDRAGLAAKPRRIHCSFSDDTAILLEIRDTDYLQIFSLPRPVQTASIRFRIDDVWPKVGALETGLGQVCAFPHAHEPTFELAPHPMYDAQNGQAVMAARLQVINPGDPVNGARLRITENRRLLRDVPLRAIPGQSVTFQDVWIPAPYEMTRMDFEVSSSERTFEPRQSLEIPAYHCYFDQGIFALNCASHNDTGWLDTQEKTADIRSSTMILPALELMRQYPEFCYTMESTTYLMEFLDRHPEHRQEMYKRMQEKRFGWGASYVQCLECHVGPENLVRQFYFGRRWLRKEFPGVDTHLYFKSDPPSLTLQMPQLLQRAGIKYLIQGRMPHGYYRWEAPDGSSVLTYAYHYVDSARLLDPKSNTGWLSYANDREYFYAPHHMPAMFMYDYTSDYLSPQPALPPYVAEQNRAMQRFAQAWNRDNPSHPIHPPRMTFVIPEQFLDELSQHWLEIDTLTGEWPFNWAYYDEPSHREGLLAGRLAHNALVTAERLYAGMGFLPGSLEYPQQRFDEAWRANCWPDHGWGGNRGVETDAVFVESYQKSKRMADELLADAGARLVRSVKPQTETQIPVAVFNPLNWQRTDVVRCEFEMPPRWAGCSVRDDAGREAPCELAPRDGKDSRIELIFVAEKVPSVGYRTFYLEPASESTRALTLSGREVENDFYKAAFGDGGLKSLFDKRLSWEVIRSGKFDAGEVLLFTAPGPPLEDLETVTMKGFDKTSNHPFSFRSFERTALRALAEREARFDQFLLRQRFSFYHSIGRVDIDLDILDWNGEKDRELRVAFPINLDEARINYEVQFGRVEVGKDELDFSLLPRDPDTAFQPDKYGGDQPLKFREAVNWIDASSRKYQQNGCLIASDVTIHVFQDASDNPALYPVLQHVLLATRKGITWNPEEWYTQEGTHHYRMCLLPHAGDWRLRYRDAIGFNFPLVAFVGSQHSAPGAAVEPPTRSYLGLGPANLIVTAVKKSEDDGRTVVRFYEAEGFEAEANLRFPTWITRACRASLIEDDQEELPVSADGGLRLRVKPWEIVTLKIAVD